MIEPYSHERPSANAAAGRAGLIELEQPMIFLGSTGERMEIAPVPITWVSDLTTPSRSPLPFINGPITYRPL